MEFPKEYYKKNDNYKYNNVKKVVNENKNDDKKKENNYEKEDEKEKNNDYENNKYGNKRYYNKKNYDFGYDNYENKENNYEYDNYDYKQRNNDYNYNYDYEDNNYYNNYNKDNYYGDKQYKNYNNEGRNNYYNYDRNYHYKKNYNNNYSNNYYNEGNYNNHKKKNDIAVELPDPINDKQENEEKNEESNNNNNNINEKNSQKINIKNKVNQINQIYMYNNMFNYMQANLMSNYQAELMRMNYISNMEHLNSNLYSPYMSPIPSTDESKVELLEKFFSEKNLNKDLNLRKNMEQDTGNIPIDFILNLNKIRSLNLNEETINELINKIGSDIIEVIKQDDKLYLRRKNFEEIKNKLKSIEDMEKESQQKINNQEQYQHNFQMNPQPVVFYPIQPIMFFGQMMAPAQQRNIQN